MSFYDDASLVFLPSGEAGKDGKAYSMKPTNGDGDFTFSRGSNLTATRVDSNGLIEKGRENTQLYTNNLSNVSGNGYGTNQVTISTSQADPFGNSEAILLTPTEINSYHRWYKLNATSIGVKTASLYVKPNGYTNVYFFCDDGNQSATFSLIGDGSITAQHAQTVDATITSVGNDGWYRISHTINAASTKWWGIYIGTGTGAYVGDGTSGVYFYGFQVEEGLVATEYIESGATTGLAGILEDSPRFDYSGGASCPSLLLEGGRTNSFDYSEYFGSLSKLNTTLETNNTTSPEGLQNASRLLSAESPTLSKYLNFQGSAPPSTENQVFSLFVKNYNHRYIQLINNGDSDLYANFDIANGIIGNYGSGTTASIEDYGNGWYRCTIVCDGSQNNINSACRIYLVDSLTQGYANQTSVALGNGVYIWGAMQENSASYPTSYIPNHSGGSVTREEDTTDEQNLSSSLGDSNTWFFELKRITNTSLSNQSIGIFKNDSTGASNRFTIYSTNNGRFRVLLSDGSGTTENLFSPNNSFEQGETIKAAVKITPSGCTLFVDGSSVDTSSSVDTITGIDAITYFRRASLKQFLMFPTALSDADCITLTS